MAGLIVALVASITVPGSGPTADDWTMFRGPNGSGVASTGLPARLTLEEDLLWKQPVAKGLSSPVFVGGKIFLTAVEGDGLLTLCLDQQTGRELWRRVAPRDRVERLDHRNHPSAASPAVSTDSVVVFFGDYGLVCYSHDGAERWRRPLGPFNNLYGMGASPLIVGGRVILVCDHNQNSFIVAVDLKTGDEAWRTERPSATSGHCTPIVYRPSVGPTQILAAGSFYLTAYSAESGKKLWWVGGLPFEMKSTPVIADEMLFINGYASPHNQPDQKVSVPGFTEVVKEHDKNANGLLEASEMPDDLTRSFFVVVDLNSDKSVDRDEWQYLEASLSSENCMLGMSLGGTGDMTRKNLRWKYHRNIPQLPSPVTAQGRLYMISDRGIVTSFRSSNGKVLQRGRLTGASGNVYASPVIAGDRVLFLTTSGKLAFVPIDDQITVEHVIRFDEPCFATPAVLGNRLYVRTNDHLFCLGR